ncbi:MAG: hypothetical protein V3V96_16555 [Acidiferrobacterales bacterium]
MDELKDSIEECLPREHPWQRPYYIEAEAQAVKACYNGTATERQQRMILEYLLRACGKDDMSYRPNDPYDTAFAEGKRWVANTLVWMLKLATTRTDPDKIAVRTAGEQK